MNQNNLKWVSAQPSLLFISIQCISNNWITHIIELIAGRRMKENKKDSMDCKEVKRKSIQSIYEFFHYGHFHCQLAGGI